MSQKNDESTAMATAIGFVGALMAAAAIFLFAVFAFFAFILTILCVFAWNNPLTLGKWTIQPSEARGFVYRGLAGMYLLPLFIGFCDVIFHLGVVWSYLPHMMGVGYVLGSIGVEVLMANANEAQAEPEILPPAPQLPAPQPQNPQPLQRAAEPFRFASWDDEEEL